MSFGAGTSRPAPLSQAAGVRRCAPFYQVHGKHWDLEPRPGAVSSSFSSSSSEGPRTRKRTASWKARISGFRICGRPESVGRFRESLLPQQPLDCQARRLRSIFFPHGLAYSLGALAVASGFEDLLELACDTVRPVLRSADHLARA